MIAEESPFRRLPINLNRRQTLFLDGMRHAAEIADFAYRRLASSLTALATDSKDDGPGSFTSLFLDAWSVVDAIDRFRQLLRYMEGGKPRPAESGVRTFLDQTKKIRALRNVGDHVAERIEHILKEQSPALGALSWCTVLNDRQVALCQILPGTVASGNHPMPNPLGKPMVSPTSFITLRAGACEVNLSDAMGHLEQVVRQLEAAISRAMAETGTEGKAAGADVFISLLMEVGEEPTN